MQLRPISLSLTVLLSLSLLGSSVGQVVDTVSGPLIPASLAGPPKDALGWAIDVDGDALVATDPGNGVGASGRAFAFWKVGGTWQADAGPIVRSDPQPDDDFGDRVALSGDTLIVTAPNHASGPRLYVFARVGTAWQEADVLDVPGVQFVGDVSLSEDRLVTVGFGGVAPGAVLFERDASGWSYSETLNDSGFVSRATVEGDRIALVTSEPAVVLLEPTQPGWSVVAHLPYNPLSQFGAPALDGDLLVVAANSQLDVYEPVGGTWSRTAQLRSALRYSAGKSSVDVRGGRITAIATSLLPGLDASASVWVREAPAGTVGTEWSERQLLEPVGSVASTRLTAAFDGETLAIGDWAFDAPPFGQATGAVLTYDVAPASEFFGDSYCHGDTSACPCGFFTTFKSGPGCQGSTLGALLVGYGSASLAEQDLRFSAHGLPDQVPALLVWGTQAAAVPAAFGNGLLCIGGQLKRAGLRLSGSDGTAEWGPGPGAFGPASAFLPGAERYFQVWYRDPDAFCGQGFNLTNGFHVRIDP